MAIATAKISRVSYSVSNFTTLSNKNLGFGEWNTSNEVYGGTGYYADGKQSPYYIWRSKIVVDLPDTMPEGANITGLTLEVNATQRCYPKFSCAVLTDKDITDDNISNMATIGSVYINQSYPKVGDISVNSEFFDDSEYYSVSSAFKDKNGSTYFNTSVDSGTKIYYKFTGDIVVPSNRRLYIYLLRSGDGTRTPAGVSGWVASKRENMSISFTYETTKAVKFLGVLNCKATLSGDISKYGKVEYSIDSGSFVEVSQFGHIIEVPYGKRLEVRVQSRYTADEAIEDRGGFIWIGTSSTSLTAPSGVSSYTVDSVTDSLIVNLDVRSVHLLKYDISNNKNEVEYLTDKSDASYDSMIMLWPHGYVGTQRRPIAIMMPGWKLRYWKRDYDGQLEPDLVNVTWNGLADCTYTPVCERIGANIHYTVDGHSGVQQKISAGESFVVGEYENWPTDHLMSYSSDKYISGWEFEHDGLQARDIGYVDTAPTDVTEDTVIRATPVYSDRMYDIYIDDSSTPKIEGAKYGSDISSLLPNSPPAGAVLYKWITDSGNDMSWENIADEAVDTVNWSTMTSEDVEDWREKGCKPLPQQRNKVTLHPVYVSSCLPIVYRNGEPRILAIKVWKNNKWNDCYMHCPVPKTN